MSASVDLAGKAAEDKELFLRFVDSMNRGDWTGVLAVWSPDMVHHGRFASYRREDVAALMGAFRAAFADLTFEVQEMAADGNWVFVRMIATCTHVADFRGLAATGKRIRVQVMGQVRIEAGRIVEHRNVMDELHFLAQVGVVDEELLKAILA
ncbi:ester cyclase [Amycolatopsis speibonae]|uniref:Ester cyclase n=1 Tax=Amycolatopsis speibonae TaxID=1450224 RepID=A0ABV7NSU3_9PSEU